jgi:hypothetical protein
MFNDSFKQIEEYSFSNLLKTVALNFLEHVAASVHYLPAISVREKMI